MRENIEQVIDAKIKCWSCKKVISSLDDFCKHCGKGQGDNISWQYKPYGIILLAIAAGPLALGNIWRSPQLSKNSKWMATIITLGITYFTVTSIIHLYKIFTPLSAEYSDIFKELNNLNAR